MPLADIRPFHTDLPGERYAVDMHENACLRIIYADRVYLPLRFIRALRIYDL